VLREAAVTPNTKRTQRLRGGVGVKSRSYRGATLTAGSPQATDISSRWCEWPGCDPAETGNEIRLAIPADIRRLYLGCVRTSIVQLL
jgi:hypothetical protein